MKTFKNYCSISINWAKQNGNEARLEPPWDDLYIMCDGEFTYKGMAIEMVPDDPEDEDWMGDSHFIVEIPGDKDWRDCVSRLAAFNIFSIVQGEEEDEELYYTMWKCGDRYWDRKVEECLQMKVKSAAKRKKQAAAALKKQKQEGVGASLMHRWLKK